MKKIKLSDFTNGRDNNFSLIRIAAAFAVLFSHSYALISGSGDAEPLRQNLGMTPGTIAVDLFFVASGFLVTGSLLKRKSTIEFVWARTLRIYPALIVTTLLTVFFVGPLFSTQLTEVYFCDVKTYTYLWKNMTLFAGAAYRLPGVFEANPYKYAVNGSLWTLPYEIKMYALLALLWGVLRVTPQGRVRIFRVIISLMAMMAGIWHFVDYYYFHTSGHPARLTFIFFSGATFYVLKEWVMLSRFVFWAFLSAIFFSVTCKPIFFLVYNVTIAYILFFLAYIPSGHIRKYNQLGDYSYGVYLYAFLVQQVVIALNPGISVLALLSTSTLITITLAVASWHLLERNALTLKGHCIDITRKLFEAHRNACSRHEP